MTRSPSKLAVLALSAAFALPAVQGATEPVPLAERVARLEQRLNAEALTGLLEQVAALREAIQTLRGQVELQGHQLSELERRQRELYRDLDRRLTRLAELDAAADRNRRAVAPTGSPTEIALYEAAINALQAKQYPEAIGALERYLGAYPQGKYADNARYWHGEALYVSGEYERALEAFERLRTEYPDSEKRAQALLKIGSIHDELGRDEQARRVLRKLASKHPGTTAARLAEQRLRRIRSAGR